MDFGTHFGHFSDGWDQAMTTFDVCNFPHRDDWKVYVACGQQPTNTNKKGKYKYE